MISREQEKGRLQLALGRVQQPNRAEWSRPRPALQMPRRTGRSSAAALLAMDAGRQMARGTKNADAPALIACTRRRSGSTSRRGRCSQGRSASA
eukprot:6187110-Pleurochrysis_carterae.AAC.2